MAAPSTSAEKDSFSVLTGSGMKLSVRDRGGGLGVASTSTLLGDISLAVRVVGSDIGSLERSGGVDVRVGGGKVSHEGVALVTSVVEDSVAASKGTFA